MQAVTSSGTSEAGDIALSGLIRGSREGFSFDTGSADVYGTVDEDRTCLSYGRIEHADVRHDLVRDAREAGEVKGGCVKTRTCSLNR